MALWDDVASEARYRGQIGQQFGQSINNQNNIANQGLWDPSQLAMLNQIFQPYFNKATANLGNQQTASLADARRSAGAQSAAGGYDNPYAMQQRAQGSVYDAYAPQFANLEQGFMGSLLNSGAQNQLFKYGNASNMSNMWGNQDMFYRQLQAARDAQPGFFENLLGSSLPGLGSFIGGGGLSGLFGGGSGGSLAGATITDKPY